MITRKKRKVRCAKKFFSILLVGFLLSYTGVMTVTAGDRNVSYLSDSQQVEKTITGKAVDSNFEPLIGVNVRVVGSREGTITDVNGQYSIIVRDNNQVLQFSYLGFKTVTVTTTDRDVINITMVEDTQALSEVVVVGYGTQRRANLTGAVSSVDVEKTLSDRPVADVGRMLQGAVPGLNISVPSGEVGSDPVINIRGAVASINGASSPLILLDNVQIPSIGLVNPDDIESISVLKDAAASSIYGARASLGVVLITTKKGATTDKVNISYSNNFSWAKLAQDFEMARMDGVEYSWDAVQRVGGSLSGAWFQINAESIERAREHYKTYGYSLGTDEPYVYGRDWYFNGTNRLGIRTFDPYDYMIKEWTPTMTHNISVSGKSGKTQYSVALGYFYQTGLIKTAKKDDFTRYNASTRISTELNKWITFRSGFLYSQREKRAPYATNSVTADHWYTMYRWGPLQPFGLDEHGSVIRSVASENEQANTSLRKDNYLNYSAGATVKFNKNWDLVADYTYSQETRLINRPGTRYEGYDSWFAGPARLLDDAGNQVKVNNPWAKAGEPTTMDAWFLPSTLYTAAGTNPDHIRRDSRYNQSNTFNAFSTYNLKLNEVHDFKFMAGTNIIYSNGLSHWIQRNRLIDYDNPSFGRVTGIDGERTGDGDDWWDSQVGFFGRFNYAFNNKYLLEANIRRDGTSKFPTHLKWRWFPSASIGWILTEENFMEFAKPFLSFWKFRASYGTIGDQTVSSGLYIPDMVPTANSGWLWGTAGNPMLRTPAYVHPDIGWQSIETLNFGIDARFFNAKLGVTYEWYRRDTKDMISAGPILPHTAGGTAPQGNFSQLRNTGWEIALDFNHRFSNGLGINVRGSLTDNEIYIHDFPEATKGFGQTTYWKGKRWGDVWGYETDGLYQWSDFVLGGDGQPKWENLQTIYVHPTSGETSETAQAGYVAMNKLAGNNPSYAPQLQTPASFVFGPGDVKYRDRNGDGLINNGKGNAEEPGDMVVIGNVLARLSYGLRIGADYKGFDFSMFWQGVGKRQIWGDGNLAIPGYHPSDGSMPQAIAGNYWRDDRTDAFYPRAFALATAPNNANTYANDRYLLDMSYLRLKNITLGYSLSSNVLKNIYLNSARIYVAFENFLTFDKLRGLPIDPETVTAYSWDGSTTNYNSGRTGMGAPIYRNASVGLQINF